MYRCLRDNANIDLERAQADLATRCETLEALSTYWWTADAMARLGRKALKSLQQPGVRKHSVANIQNAMDAEVAVCKFGPFDRKSNAAPNSSTSKAETGTHTGNALHVLSDAAATHSTTTPPTPLPPTPHQFGAATTADTAGPLNVSAFDQYQYQFNDLDNLFEGFFDLSMPTIFQDPLFDGDAFMNADLGLGFGAEADHTTAAGTDTGTELDNVVVVEATPQGFHTMTPAAAGGTALVPMPPTTNNMVNSASGLAPSRTTGPGAPARGAQRTMYPDIGLS